MPRLNGEGGERGFSRNKDKGTAFGTMFQLVWFGIWCFAYRWRHLFGLVSGLMAPLESQPPPSLAPRVFNQGGLVW